MRIKDVMGKNHRQQSPKKSPLAAFFASEDFSRLS